MKHLLVGLIVLGLFVSPLFSEATDVPEPIAPEMTASVASRVGYDLESGQYGLKNTAEVSFVFKLFGGTTESGSDGGVITVKDVEFGLDGAKAGGAPTLAVGDIIGRIVVGSLWVSLGQYKDPSVNYSQSLKFFEDQLFSGKYGVDKTSMTTLDPVEIMGGPGVNVGGLEVGYKVANVVTLTGEISTRHNWETDAADYKQGFEYAFSFDQKAITGLILGGKFINGTDPLAEMGIGTKLGYDFNYLSVEVDTDADLTTKELSSSGAVSIPDVIPGFGVSLNSTTGYDFSKKTLGQLAKVSIGKKLLYLGNFDFGYGMADITNSVTSRLYAAFEMPSFLPGYTAYIRATGMGKKLFAKTGLSATKIIKDVAFNCGWDSSDLNNSMYGTRYGYVWAEAKVSY